MGARRQSGDNDNGCDAAAEETKMTKKAVDALVECLAARGVRHIFGVPGGDCSLDIIEAAAKVGIDFVLTRTENAAGIAAAATAEITGSIGVVMTTRGPGIASGVNGLAYASLDRVPLLLIADHYDDDLDYVSHQRFDHMAMLRPLLRGAARLDGAQPAPDFDRLIDEAFGLPPGPVYLEVTAKGVRMPVPDRAPAASPSIAAAPDPGSIEAAGALIARAKRPLIIAGLQARDRGSAEALRRLAERWQAPVFTTYRAKGAMPESHPLAIGHYIGGVGEEPIIRQADLILFYGFDAIECPPGRWRYSTPVIEMTRHAFERHLVEPDVSIVGDIAAAADRLANLADGSAWEPGALGQARAELRDKANTLGGQPIAPQMVVEAAMRYAPANARITIDAGAHMLPVLHHWRCEEPTQTMVSRGLATMGYALPAALGASLAEPGRPVIAFTGDGGLMMCSGELATAAQHGCKPVVVVFNDSSLTLIGAKQRRRQLPNEGVDFSPANFASIAAGYGCDHHRVERPEDLDMAFAAAFAADRPALIDVVIDPEPYHAQLLALRG